MSDAAGMVTIENMTPGPFEFDVTAVGEPRGSNLAGKYARWWSPDAIEEHQRKIEYDSSSFQRNFDDLTFNILGNTEPVKIYVEKAVSIRGRVTDPDGNPVVARHRCACENRHGQLDHRRHTVQRAHRKRWHFPHSPAGQQQREVQPRGA